MNRSKAAAWQTGLIALDSFVTRHRILIQEPCALWHKSVKARLDEVCALAAGWDGYRGRPVDFSAANFALRILEAVCGPDTPVPSIVPGLAGDLQIEWHTREWDIELHIIRPYLVRAWRERVGGPEETLDLTNDFVSVRKWVGELSEPLIASLSTAA